mmetsp:Transcript_47358/g.48197  ORF Transcript_47358/g.48197 Transcript_47358/m.48197 type:complete len:103 (-) Transcript_47358:703-1011(-)
MLLGIHRVNPVGQKSTLMTYFNVLDIDKKTNPYQLKNGNLSMILSSVWQTSYRRNIPLNFSKTRAIDAETIPTTRDVQGLIVIVVSAFATVVVRTGDAKILT